MPYVKRDWDNTGNEVTKDDFKRIENGIGHNDQELANIKNGDISGSLQQQINVLSEKTHFNLIASVDYTIVSQNCYIQDGRTYVQAVFKRTDEEVFGTGALYIASSNILPEGTYACNAICFFALPMNGIINDFIQISVRGKNILVANSLTNLKVVSFTCVCC